MPGDDWIEAPDDVEEVTAEPVLDGEGPRPATPVASASAPVHGGGEGRAVTPTRTGQVVVQAAAVAATGLVAGAATTALVRAAKGRRGRSSARRRGEEAVPRVVETRTYVVDVHLVARR